jgi:hypothetical protein
MDFAAFVFYTCFVQVNGLGVGSLKLTPSPPSPSPSPPAPPAGAMNSWCDNHQVQGWPTFNNQAALSGDAKWSQYFKSVYGSVPTTGYPICIGGMYFAYKNAMEQAGISTSSLASVDQEFGGTIWTIDHGSNSYHLSSITGNTVPKAFASNTWVEGLHCQTSEEKHSAWYWYYPGSGIWIWSGTTEAFMNRYDAQQKYLGWHSDCNGSPTFECGGKLFTTAKSKFGIDTVQYVGETDDITFMFIVTTGEGRYTCGSAQTQWKAGWAASRSCNCDQTAQCQNCQGVGMALLGNGNGTSGSPCFV